MLGIPQFKERNKEKETFQKQSAMLEEVVKLPLALVWHPPKKGDNDTNSVEALFSVHISVGMSLGRSP